MERKCVGEPLISVVMPTYNYGHLIEESITSVLNQTHQNVELIVVDDGSTDNTEATVKELAAKDDRIVYIKISNSKNPTARNTGFLAAKGDYIATIDSDDLWPREKLDHQLKVLKDNPDAIVLGNVRRFYVDKNGAIQWTTTTHLPSLSGDYVHNVMSMATNQMVHFNTLLARAEIIKKEGLWDPLVVTAHDWENWIRLAKKYSFVHLDEILQFYRKHEKSKTVQNSMNLALYYQLMVVNRHSPKGAAGFLRRLRYKRLRYEEAIDGMIYQRRPSEAAKLLARAALNSNVLFKADFFRRVKEVVVLFFRSRRHLDV